MPSRSAVSDADPRRPPLRADEQAVHLTNTEAVSLDAIENSPIELDREGQLPSHSRPHPSMTDSPSRSALTALPRSAEAS
jgi:hypothetical protein